MSRVSEILLMALKVALSGNDCMKSLPSSILLLSWGSKGTEPEMDQILPEKLMRTQAHPIDKAIHQYAFCDREHSTDSGVVTATG